MKPVLEVLNSPNDSSLLAFQYEAPVLPFKWHYHPEYELTWIQKGKGKRFVGDCLQGFQSGDLVLLGKNLPHTWVSDGTYPSQAALVIQFADKLVSHFFGPIAEWQKVKVLLEMAQRGVRFKVEAAFFSDLDEILKLQGEERLLKFYGVLVKLSKVKFEPLSSANYQMNKKAEKRINIVFNYIYEHFYTDLSLDVVADLVYLTPSSFSRFFKAATQKSFVQYVNEVRVDNVCKMLINTDLLMLDIALANGFNNLVHFNRIFKELKGTSPSKIRAVNNRKNLL